MIKKSSVSRVYPKQPPTDPKEGGSKAFTFFSVVTLPPGHKIHPDWAKHRGVPMEKQPDGSYSVFLPYTPATSYRDSAVAFVSIQYPRVVMVTKQLISENWSCVRSWFAYALMVDSEVVTDEALMLTLLTARHENSEAPLMLWNGETESFALEPGIELKWAQVIPAGVPYDLIG